MNSLRAALAGALLPFAAAAADPYEEYLLHSEDFRPVPQEKAWAYRAFPSWTMMPWTFQWGLGYTEASGRWCLAHGYNGAFLDRGDPAGGKLGWINQFKLRFYVDHLAGKGTLHLYDGDAVKPHLAELHGTGLRPVLLNAATFVQLQKVIRAQLAAVKESPYRAAYALDDEASWGHFVHPAMWQITDDATAYPKWLAEVYGPAAPKPEKWYSYEDLRPKLADWSVRDFDASPLLDQWAFNDSLWANYLGALVEYTNSLDSETPCGIVGGQAPNAFGGYDYAKLMRKLQFIEAYDLGSSQAILRSFNPHNALPLVTSLFHRSAADDLWQTWYYLAHGNRGHIAWVEGWFDGATPKPWHEEAGPAFVEAAGKIGPLLSGAEWQHDGVALYYSQSSLELGWMLDAEAHGKTWGSRNADERLSSAGNVRKAWENMLRDAGLQYSYLSYVDVVQKGVPPEYKVLILPATLCLSDAEARRIQAFCAGGGTVVADYLPGVWDQHGKGRPDGGALDALFGVKHDPTLRAREVFGGRLWVEVDQDANYSFKTYEEFMTQANTCPLDPSGFHLAVRGLPTAQSHEVGRGHAVLMNLSPQYYNAYRGAGAAEAAKRRETFLRPVLAGGVHPSVRLRGAGEREHGYEITYWTKGGRTILFLCQNPETTGTSLGGGNSVGLKTDTVPITLEFARAPQNVRDERSGQPLPAGREVSVTWKQNEAVVLSFDRAE